MSATLLRTAGEDFPEIWCRCDRGPHGYPNIAAHAHADALSVEVRYAGVDILAGSAIVAGNEIIGSPEGIMMDGVTGALVVGNEIKDSGDLGIALIDYSSNNLIARNEVTNSGTFDLFWDGTGTGNHWLKNVYTTSYPPNLST